MAMGVVIHARREQFGAAWVALTLALAAHVVDEALTGFLDVYNPIVRDLRSRISWFPMPTFTFGVWITGLVAVVVVLMVLSTFAFRQSPAVRLAAYPYAALMMLNGLGHLIGSVYLGRWAPGATTAPLLVAASLWLLSTVVAAAPAPVTRPRRP